MAELEVDTRARTVRRGGRRIDLKPKEYALLEYLMRNSGRPLTRALIVEHVWDIHFDSVSNVVEVHINSLRNEIGARIVAVGSGHRRAEEPDVKKTQVQGVHHITIVGSTKQSAVDFWQGALGMPFVMEQPNLGKPDENHLYFDPGDGRLLTVFTNESREDAKRHAPRDIGCVEHIAFNVSRATFLQAPARLRDRGIDFIQRDRGFMDSIYLHDPNGLKIELACYKFETPEGYRDVDVLMKAHHLRVERGDHHITEEHLADAIELLLAERPRLAVGEKLSTPA